MRRSQRWVAVVLAGMLPAACFLPSFEERKESTTGGLGGQGQGGSIDPCSARWPQPLLDTSTDSDTIDEFLALRSIDFGEADPLHAPGLDLDRSCTCCVSCPDIATCSLPAGAQPACDSDAGRDNGIARLFAAFPEVLPSSGELRASIDAGQWSILVRFWNYNGLPDDDRVNVAIYTTPPLASPPLWDGNDGWSVRDDSLDSGASNLDQAAVTTDQGYVVGGRLVADFGSGKPLALSLPGGFSMKLSRGILSAKVESVGGRFQLSEGSLGGMWAMADVFVALGVPLESGAAFICRDAMTYPVIKSTVCSYRDIHTAIDAAAPCNAISYGLSFSARPAIFAGIVPGIVPPVGLGCAVDQNPAGDTCD